jgi:hypothetical protein
MIRVCLKLSIRLPCDPTFITSANNSLHRGQAYCSSCHRSAANLANATPRITLKRCEQCELVSACGECTLQHSPEVCKQYQEMNRIDLFRIAHFELTGNASIYLPTPKPRTSYKPLSSAANWADYYFNISGRCITHEPFLQRVLITRSGVRRGGGSTGRRDSRWDTRCSSVQSLVEIGHGCAISTAFHHRGT